MAKTTIPIELSSTPSIVDGGNATAITIDSSENVTFAGGLVIPSTITHAGDTDTKLDFNQANTLRLITGDNTAWICNASSMVINEDSIDFDFRVESNGNANMLFVDGGNDRVGINGTGTNARGGSNTVAVFDVSGSGKNYVEIQGATDSTANGLLFSDGSSGNYGVVGYNHASDNMNFFTAGSERMRIASDGKVSIGTTTTDRELKVQNSSDHAIIGAVSGTSSLAGMVMGDTSDDDTGAVLYNNNGNYLYFQTNTAERMRIESDGDVTIGDGASNIDIGIGNTGTVGHLGRTGSGALIHLGGDDCQIRLANSILHHDNSGNTNLYLRNHYTTLGNDNSAKVTLESGTLVFATSTAYTERMRITSNGSVFIGTTGEPTGSTGGAGFSIDNNDRANFICATTGTGNLELIEFRNPNGTVGDIKSNGSGTSYNTSSDYRLKENVDYTWDATTRLKQLKPARFNFKVDADTTVDGFLAHEVSSIVPIAVSGEKDGEKMQSIDHSKLVPLLVKTIQELEERITTLEG